MSFSQLFPLFQFPISSPAAAAAQKHLPSSSSSRRRSSSSSRRRRSSSSRSRSRSSSSWRWQTLVLFPGALPLLQAGSADIYYIHTITFFSYWSKTFVFAFLHLCTYTHHRCAYVHNVYLTCTACTILHYLALSCTILHYHTIVTSHLCPFRPFA